MTTLFKDWQPTVWDSRANYVSRQRVDDPDYDTWIVVPVIRTRDAGPFEESNFYSALKMLGGESDTCANLRFGHWACGWYDKILVHPSRAKEVEEIEAALEEYPILDEQDFGEREEEARWECWKDYGLKDFVKEVAAIFDLSDLAQDLLKSDPQGRVSYWHGQRTSGDEVDEGGGTHFMTGYLDRASREDIAKLLWECRKYRNKEVSYG